MESEKKQALPVDWKARDAKREKIAAAVYRQFLSEFDARHIRWVYWLFGGGGFRFTPPIVWCVCIIGLIAGVFAHVAHTGAFSLTFSYQFTFPPPKGIRGNDFNYVLGYFAEPNFGFWLIIGFPIFLALIAKMLWSFSYGFAILETNEVISTHVLKGEEDSRASLVPKWSQHRSWGYVWVSLGVLIALASVVFQSFEFHRVSSPKWIVPDNARPMGMKVDFEEFKKAKTGFDFGNTWRPILVEKLVKPFNSSDLSDSQRADILASRRTVALIEPWAEYARNVRGAKDPMGTDIDTIRNDIVAHSTGPILSLVEPGFKTAKSDPQAGAAYWCFLVLAYGVTGVAWIVTGWALLKIALMFWIVLRILWNWKAGTFRLHLKPDSDDLGIGHLFDVLSIIPLMAVASGCYIALMRNIPIQYFDQDGKAQYIREGLDGFSWQSELIDIILVGIYLLILIAGFVAWKIALHRLVREQDDSSRYKLLDFWAYVKTVVSIVALAVPFWAHFADGIGDPILKVPLIAKNCVSAVFHLPKQGAYFTK